MADQSSVRFCGGPFDGRECSYWQSANVIHTDVSYAAHYLLVNVATFTEDGTMTLRAEFRWVESQ